MADHLRRGAENVRVRTRQRYRRRFIITVRRWQRRTGETRAKKYFSGIRRRLFIGIIRGIISKEPSDGIFHRTDGKRNARDRIAFSSVRRRSFRR